MARQSCRNRHRHVSVLLLAGYWVNEISFIFELAVAVILNCAAKTANTLIIEREWQHPPLGQLCFRRSAVQQ
jgi:hypothetical protein